MSNQKAKWYFYNRQNKTQLGPLDLEALCSFLVTNQFELNYIYLCKPGWSKWKIGLEIPEFIDQYQKVLGKIENFLPLLEVEQVVINEQLTPIYEKNTNVDLENENILPASKPIKESTQIRGKQYWEKMRKHPRFAVELKVIFIADKKSFRSRTLDISLGRIKIADPLPSSYFDRKIEVYLSSADLKICGKII